MSHRLSKEELDRQFELFLKESVSDDSVDLGGSENQQLAHTKNTPWWQDDDNSLEGTESAVIGKTRFIKAKKSQAENRDAVPTNSAGLDTLEEEEEKARFFGQLEAGASSTIDYSKLNRDLDSTNSTLGPDIRRAEEAVRQKEHDPRTATDSPSSPNYSEDFEAEEIGNEKSTLSPVLAKDSVSLNDSLEEKDTKKDTAGSPDRGQSYGQSGGSDMEALHDAYRLLHVVEDPHDQNQHSPAKSEGELERPVSPTSQPQHATQTLFSTSESELPTAEELMRRIRPDTDGISALTLQPVSAVEFDKDKTSHLLEGTSAIKTSPEANQKHPGTSDIEVLKGASTSESPPPSNPDQSIQDLTWNIKEEVERLMQDHKSSSQTSSKGGEAKKQKCHRGSAMSLPTTSSVKKSTMATGRGGRVGDRTAKLTGHSRTVTSAKSQASVLRNPKPSLKPIKDRDDDNSSCTELPVSSELVASVQSLVTVLQEKMEIADGKDSLNIHGSQKNKVTQCIENDDSASLVEELKVQLAQKDLELQILKQETIELSSVKQQNFLLQSKLRCAEEAGQKRTLAETTDLATEERLQQCGKEIKEQERLIKGYQQENEKLYLQMKAQQARIKVNEQAMFHENQRLLNELVSTREQLSDFSKPIGNVCYLGHSQRIAELLGQIDTFQQNEDRLSQRMSKLKHENQALKVDLELMMKEKELAKVQTITTSVSGDTRLKTYDASEQRQEQAALRKTLQCFDENQVLLARDAERLEAATAEIQRLKQQVEKLKTEVGKRTRGQQTAAKNKFLETKKMQHLERQVKELEQILRSRNPNSIPAIIYAAAKADTQDGSDSERISVPGGINALLECRIQRLEAELESRDEQAKHSLQSMEQHFHGVKLRYERRISDLEQQLEQRVQAAASEQGFIESGKLQEELAHEKEVHQQREQSLRNQIETLQQQLKQKAQPSPGRHQQQAEEAFGVRINRLNQELATKTRTIQMLNRTVENLQKERKSMLANPHLRNRACSSETKQQAIQTRIFSSTTAGEDTFPDTYCEKTYEPTVFTGRHISEVLEENQALKEQTQLLKLQSEQEKEAQRSSAVQLEEELCRLQEQLSNVKSQHLQELDRLHAKYALEHSSSKVAQLSSELNKQEMMVSHLKEQLKEMQGTREALVLSKKREDALQAQLSRLLKDIKEAKEAQKPEVKLICNLEKKILNMELRHQHREKELQQMIRGAWEDPEQQSEVDHWKRLAQDKSRDLDAFRLELDSILEVLKHLQSQGVVLTPRTGTLAQKTS